jgi:geranylgeranyl diphosphate synthase type II
MTDISAQIRGDFEDFLVSKIRPHFEAGSVPALNAPVLYSLENPGKRIRPVLFLMFAGYEDRGEERKLFGAAALECIHTYSLIHDDLPSMDNDDLRRGRPSCHKQFSDWGATLAGDALNTYAFELLALAFEGRADAALATGILAKLAGRQGMVSGQALDLLHEKGRIPGDADALSRIHRMKTAALIRAACELGAVYAGADNAHSAHAAAFGEALGMLFQITDDLLDARGSADAGKRTGKDAEAGKLTYPSVFGMEKSQQIARDFCAEALRILNGIALPGRHGLENKKALAELTESLPDRSK